MELEPASESFNILMVCTGNICRSPGAERLLALELSQLELPDGLPIKIRSAGMRGWDAAPMDEAAAAALTACGGSAEGFVSRRLTEPMAESADLILTATKDHRSEVVELSPRSLRKTFTMKELAHLVERDPQRYAAARELVAAAYRRRGGAEISDLDIADPFRGTEEQHQLAMREIHACMKTIAEALATTNHP